MGSSERGTAAGSSPRGSTERGGLGGSSPRGSTERGGLGGSSEPDVLHRDRWCPGPPPRLLGSRCDAAGCGEVTFPPRPLCPDCWGPTTTVELPATGTLYTFTTVHVPSGHAQPPYTLGYADFGTVRVLGQVVGGEPRIGAPVTVTAISAGPDGPAGGPGIVYAFEVARQ
jgi:uncharacterized OB-fold protein